MSDFCPFIRERCKGGECVAWRDGKCLIVSFLYNTVQNYERTLEEDEKESQVTLGIRPFLEEEEEKVKIPDEIVSATPEEIAAELISFAEKAFSSEGVDEEEKRRRVYETTRLFWEEKEIDIWMLPLKIRSKIEKAERLAQDHLEKQSQAKIQEQREKEKKELPSLIKRCVEWARERGLKRISQSDVEAFLLENEIEVLYDTQRALWSVANVQIKSSKSSS